MLDSSFFANYSPVLLPFGHTCPYPIWGFWQDACPETNPCFLRFPLGSWRSRFLLGPDLGKRTLCFASFCSGVFDGGQSSFFTAGTQAGVHLISLHHPECLNWPKSCLPQWPVLEDLRQNAPSFRTIKRAAMQLHKHTQIAAHLILAQPHLKTTLPIKTKTITKKFSICSALFVYEMTCIFSDELRDWKEKNCGRTSVIMKSLVLKFFESRSCVFQLFSVTNWRFIISLLDWLVSFLIFSNY